MLPLSFFARNIGAGILDWYRDRVRAGEPGFDSRQGKKIFLFTASGQALGPNQPHIQWVLGGGVFPQG
jgi:hypothetical protein